MLKLSGYMKQLWLIFILLLLWYPSAFSQSYSSPLSFGGGVDTHLYKCDTVMFEATAMDDTDAVLNGRTLSAGLSMLHSPYLSLFYIPLKYGLGNNFQISFSLPYMTKTLVGDGTHYIKSGYGDTMLGLTKSFEKYKIFSSSTTFRITLPTGNVNAQDSSYLIPMGYGGYTTSIQEFVSFSGFDSGFCKIRPFVSGILIYYFNSSQQIDSTTTYSFDSCYAWSVMLGSEFHITGNLDLQLKLNYIDVKERRYTSTDDPGVKYDANDSVKQINIIPFAKYRLLDDVSGKFGIIYPVKTVQDRDLSEHYNSKWKIAMGIEKIFGDGASGRK